MGLSSIGPESPHTRNALTVVRARARLGFVCIRNCRRALEQPTLTSAPNNKSEVSRMTLTNFNVTTPQSKAVKNLIEAYLSLDIYNIVPFISKDFKFQTFPKIAGLPDEVKEGHLERYGLLFSMVTSAKVCI